METKKEFKYHLKKDVREDLEFLHLKVSSLLNHDDEGFVSIPSWPIIPAFFRVFSHLLWVRNYNSWFKKVYCGKN